MYNDHSTRCLCHSLDTISMPFNMPLVSFTSTDMHYQLVIGAPKVGAATKYLKPLRATPLHWLVVAATATSATFSKSRNGYALLRYSAIATTAPCNQGQRKERRQPAGDTADPSQLNPRLTGVSAERHWPGGGRITPPPSLTPKPMTAARRARRRWKGLGETVLKHS